MFKHSFRIAIALLVALHADVVSGQDRAPPPPPLARLKLDQAKELLSAGSATDAEKLYTDVLASTNNNLLRAEAFLGRGVAAYGRFLASDASTRAALGDSILRDYSAADELSAGRHSAAARNNMALVMRALDRHNEARTLFNSAASASAPSTRASFYINAGREYETLGDTRNAAQRYEEALRDDSTSVNALASLLRVLGSSARPRDILAVAARWRRNETHARAVVEATADLLAHEEPPPSEDAARALVFLASALPTARLGPSAFDGSVRDRLRRGAIALPSIAPGIESLIDAYAPRRREDVYVEPPSSHWWRSAPEDGRAAWSSVLRSLGDWHDQQGAQNLARSYYERAIGLGTSSFAEPWIDRRALKPLGLIYAQTDEGHPEFQAAVSNYSEMLFAAKGAAYSKGDLEQIRDFHMTLGAIYAEREQWTGPGARNAEFQIENMRRATAELNRLTDRKLIDPPDLLEKLALRYDTTNRQAKAAELKTQLRTDYEKKGRPDLGDDAARRIETRTVKPPNEVPRATPVRATELAVVPERNAPTPPRAAEIIPERAVTSGAGRAAAQATVSTDISIVITLTNGSTRTALVNASVSLTVDGEPRRIESDAEGKIRLTVPRGTTEVRLSVTASGFQTLTGTYKVEQNLSLTLRPR